MVPPKYPELKRVITIVRRPVIGPRVAMNAVEIPPRAPKQRIVATALLERISVVAEQCSPSDIPKTQSENRLCEYANGNGSQHCVNRPTQVSREHETYGSG